MILVTPSGVIDISTFVKPYTALPLTESSDCCCLHR